MSAVKSSQKYTYPSNPLSYLYTKRCATYKADVSGSSDEITLSHTRLNIMRMASQIRNWFDPIDIEVSMSIYNPDNLI